MALSISGNIGKLELDGTKNGEACTKKGTHGSWVRAQGMSAWFLGNGNSLGSVSNLSNGQSSGSAEAYCV